MLLCHVHHIAVEHGGFKIRGKPPNITIELPDGRSMSNGPPDATEDIEHMFLEELFDALGEGPRPYGGDYRTAEASRWEKAKG